MSAKQNLYQLIASGELDRPTDVEIARYLNLPKRQIKEIENLLQALSEEGKLLVDSDYRYGTPEQMGAKKGKISGNERGFGFFLPEDKSGDLFLPRRALHGALHGDTVYARQVNGKSDDEGEVLAILERGYTELVGTFYRDHRGGHVVPDEIKYAEEIFIPFRKCTHIPNDKKVVVKITEYPEGRSPGGEILEVLGDDDDFFVEELSIIRSHKLREEFPEDVIAEAERVSRKNIVCGDRLDLRDTLIVTVDGEDTRDIDDAISLTFEQNRYRLGVHIADVTEYVAPRSALDKEAFTRGTSVYFPDRVLPMLPKALSNGCCSLNEDEDRYALSCLIELNDKGTVLSSELKKTLIRSRHRLTYTAVSALFDGDKTVQADYPDLIEFMQHAKTLTKLLEEKRAARGGVDLDVKEAKILLTEENEILIPDYERTAAHRMIEQFMVLANEQVATLMTKQKMPFVYRVHERPAPEKAEGFSAFLAHSGVPADFDADNVTPQDYRRILEGLQGQPLFSIVNRVMLRSMQKAKYASVNAGHFGLASDCYCHFTSPIRRYPDLCIHRIIKLWLEGKGESAREKYAKFVDEAAEHSSVTEQIAAEAERDVDELYITQYMADHIGEEYDAVISGVTSFGLFAELDSSIEGKIPVETLPDDSYEFFEEQFLLKGKSHAYRIGERIRIRVDGCDFASRRVIFGLIEK